MNIWEDYTTMPLADLKKYYNRQKRAFRFLSGLPCVFVIPAMFVYGLLGWVSFFISESTMFMSKISIGGGGAADYIVFAICGAILMSHSKRSNNEAIYVMASYILLKFLFLTSITIMSALMLLYIILIRVPLNKINRKLEFMRCLPTFPFNERVSSAMFNQQKLVKQEHLIRTSAGITVSNDYDKLLEKSYKPPELSEDEKETKIPDDYFQRHKLYMDGKITESTLTDNELARQNDTDGCGLGYKEQGILHK